MKGQYLAIETIITVAMGISLAVGSISFFNSYQDNALDTAERAKVLSVRSQVLSSVQSLRYVESGRIDFTLPEQISGDAYVVELGNDLRVTSVDSEYEFDTGMESVDLDGQARGGPVSLIKTENEIIMRPR